MIFTQKGIKEALAAKDAEIASLTSDLSAANIRLEEMKGANERIAELEQGATEAAEQLATANAATASVKAELATAQAAIAAHPAALQAALESASAQAVQIAAAAGLAAPLVSTATNESAGIALSQSAFDALDATAKMNFRKNPKNKIND